MIYIRAAAAQNANEYLASISQQETPKIQLGAALTAQHEVLQQALSLDGSVRHHSSGCAQSGPREARRDLQPGHELRLQSLRNSDVHVRSDYAESESGYRGGYPLLLGNGTSILSGHAVCTACGPVWILGHLSPVAVLGHVLGCKWISMGARLIG